ncbi:hypothetical protein ARAM_004784 [Aspergillus rambellii]|uniref:Uncharacterized protein n=3 Tax=Aspergillus subgen. Nidulantes TaxID=2720870 RepID=A0A0F8UCV2_9EURO|nr:hypothetical protein ARAM_004784 [Aspergillus rambellii]
MQLGITEHLPALVARRFTAAKDAGHLVFSQTHLSIVHAGGIPYQLRYCPALAKKPSAAPKQAHDSPKPRFDPFQDPSPDLLIAQIPRDNPTHFLVLNKFPVIPNHFILATKAWQSQTDLLERRDLAAAYACVKEWRDEPQTNGPATPRRLFAFFNSGDESGASQPHRHLQFLPVEAMSQDDPSGAWRPLIDAISSQPGSPDSKYRCLAQLPLAHFALPLPSNPSAEVLHDIYISLYRAAAAAAGVPKPQAQATTGPAVIPYNLAMTESMMMICPRKTQRAFISVDAAASKDVAEAGVVELNGTILAGTLMVKAEAEWDELRQNPDTLTNVLADIGFPHPDSRQISLLSL